MKKIFFPRRNALLTHGGVRMLAAALAVAVVVVAFRLALPGVFISTTSPILSAGTTLSNVAADFLAVFADAATLKNRTAALESENEALAAENRALAARLADVFALMGTAIPGTTPGIAAGVLLAPPVAAYDTLVVSAGTTDGVRTGMEAFGAADTPLGFVSSVAQHTSRITLFSSPAVNVSGWAGAKHAAIMLEGTGGGTFTATVPRASGISVGDVVSVPGPGALPIGIVTELAGDPSAPNVTLHIKPAVNPFSITWVELRDAGSSLKGALQCASSTLP